ncbi:MAG: hypothetical protein EU547_06305 [Promethearchaeota archaeon]|nr:MAG: hypothetical protein EU547_06305 [Candidatus Lokiarchaeota archaeon]
MIYNQFDIGRILQVFFIQGLIALFFLYILYQILKRGRKRINILFAFAYLFVLIGLINNMVYAFIRNEPLLIVLNFITNFTVTFGLIFLTLFNMLIFFSEKKIDTKWQITIIIIYGAILFLQILFLPFGGIIANESTNWKALWSFPYYLYVITVISVGSIAPTIIISIQIYLEMHEPELKQRWVYFIIGALGVVFYMYGVFTVDLFNDTLIRFIWSLISLTIVLWIYLMYYGVGRQLSSK